MARGIDCLAAVLPRASAAFPSRPLVLEGIHTHFHKELWRNSICLSSYSNSHSFPLHISNSCRKLHCISTLYIESSAPNMFMRRNEPSLAKEFERGRSSTLGAQRLQAASEYATYKGWKRCSLTTYASPGKGERRTDVSACPEGAIELLAPVSRLLDAEIVYAAAPSLGHHQEGHPESNQRVTAILEALDKAQLTPKARGNSVVQLTGFAPALPSSVAAVHTTGYVRGLERSMELAAEEGLILIEGSGPTYATAFTYSESMLATGAALAVVDAIAVSSAAAAVSKGGSTCPAGFALVRPPGHHAVPTGPMGFCLLDHVAVAARHAQIHHGLKRVMIVDFDVHHGNGTHDMFYGDPDVFFLSTHQLGSYPGTGRMEEVGQGSGEGTTLNLPLPGGSGDQVMAACMREVIAPAAANFKPDIILVSAGYDAHFLDDMAGLQFTTGTYHRLTKDLHALARQLCGGRIVFFLEGGYHLHALGSSVADSFRALLGVKSAEGLDELEGLYEEPMVTATDAIAKIRSIHSLV
eukprot:TRINITY_DN3244_c0_g1_i1.p1 TRINITY_DN3244_c0_g1~~TRINITY_DN3244_c0_g1_i1.p1  ORF type:complete len:524 (-),score=67.32 TRINITY_DN3244_c0_g1_i1:543-2114(-)